MHLAQLFINIKVTLWTGYCSHEMIALVQITTLPADISAASHLSSGSPVLAQVASEVSFSLSVWTFLWALSLPLASQLWGRRRVQPVLPQLCERLPMQSGLVEGLKHPGKISILGYMNFYNLSDWCLDTALGRLQSHCCLVFQVTVPFQLFMVPSKKVVCGKVVILFLTNCNWY